MQKLPHGGASTPASHAGVAALGRFVEPADQGRQHVAVGGVIVVARAIQIGGQLLLFEKSAPTQKASPTG